MPKFDTAQLVQKIEQVVLEHLAATEAIARAFTTRRPSVPRPASTRSERGTTRRRRPVNEASVETILKKRGGSIAERKIV